MGRSTTSFITVEEARAVQMEHIAVLAGRLSSAMRKVGWDKRPEWYAVNRVARDASEATR